MQVFRTTQLKLVAVAVVAVSLWQGGFGCSFCCATGVTDACCEGGRGLSAKAECGSDSCCNPSLEVNEAASSESVSQPEGLRSCSLLPSQVTSLSAEHRISADLVPAAEVAGSQVEPYSSRQAEVFSDSPLPRNRGATYLRCCVLLI
jgi:hypothetical protein